MTDPNALGRGPVSLSRVLSFLLASAYVIAAFAWGDLRQFLYVLLGSAFLLACIWIPETMGETRPLQPTRWSASPPSLVWFLSWCLLLAPLVVGACVYVRSD